MTCMNYIINMFLPAGVQRNYLEIPSPLMGEGRGEGEREGK